MGNKSKVIVTGGAGYIGSHTIIELLERTDHDVVSIDDFSNSGPETFDRIHAITGHRIRNYEIDLCDKVALNEVIMSLEEVVGVIHFAAFKSVPESMREPYKYHYNNNVSLLNVLDAVVRAGIPHFIFSSSCSVYGNIEVLPVNEDTPLSMAESPYAYTKQVGERIVSDFVRTYSGINAISLRYFNPVGAHRSGSIGEDPVNPPSSLVPIITRTAIGEIEEMMVHGGDYGTRDGSCIRDYVHVSDIATAHVLALHRSLNGALASRHEILNLGTGNGVSVLEAIAAFEEVSGVKLNYRIGPRRDGDVEAIYSDTLKSRTILGWEAEHDLKDMMRTAWAWEQGLARS